LLLITNSEVGQLDGDADDGVSVGLDLRQKCHAMIGVYARCTVIRVAPVHAPVQMFNSSACFGSRYGLLCNLVRMAWQKLI